MTLQKIKSLDGKDEYVLVPVSVYRALKDEIEGKLSARGKHRQENEYVPFVLEDYVDNPITLRRIRARLTQKELAVRLGVTQAYISKVEHQDKVSPKLLHRVRQVLKQTRNPFSRREKVARSAG